MRTDPLEPQIQRELDAIDAALEGRPVEPELTELGALALALRDDRPEIDDAFARSLDTRVAAGFPKESRRSRFGAWLAPRRMVMAGAVASMLLALVVAAPLLTGGGDSVDDFATSAPEGRAPIPQSEESAGSGAAMDSATSGASPAGSVIAPTPPPPTGGSPRSDRRTQRKVEKSASMTLVAAPDAVQDVGQRIIGVAQGVGGFVVSSSLTATEEGGGGTFLLRVPEPRLADALSRLSGLAHVQSLEQATQDITSVHASARERLQDARAERKSLLRRLAAADTDTEAESLKAQLRDVNRRISAAKADLSRVNNRATFSNVSVTLSSDPQANGPEEDEGAWSPGDALGDAVRILEVAAGVAVIALAIALPLALLVVAGLVATRWAARRSRRRALDAV